MAHEQHLHDLMDGSLEYGDEVALFSELSTSEELRRDLKSLLLIRQAVAHDSRAYTPAPDSQAAIFARLGFGVGAPGPSQAPSMPTRGSYQSIVGGIVGAAVVLLLLVLTNDRPAAVGPSARNVDATTLDKHTITSRGAAQQTSIPPPGSRASSSIASTTASVQATAADRGTIAPPSVRRTAPTALMQPTVSARANRRVPAHTADGIAASGITDAVLVAPIEPRRTTSNGIDARTAARDDLHPDTHTIPTPLPDIRPDAVRTPIAVEVRASALRSTHAIPAAIASTPGGILKDRGLSVLYRLDDDQYVGGEIGQESFYQRWEIDQAGGDRLLYEQNPALYWFGGTYRRMLRTGIGLEPFAQATLGATRSGPMARAMLGTSFFVAEELRMFAGFEGATLSYRERGVWYFSSKFGVSYGMSLRF